MYRGALFTVALLQRFPNHRRRFTVAGLAITSIALISSSFVTHEWQLLLTQNILYAICDPILYFSP